MPSIGCWVNFSFFKFDVDLPIIFYMPWPVVGVLDSLGEFMAGELIDRDSENIIGRSLGRGVLGLFDNYLDLSDKLISVPKPVSDSVGKLTEKV